MSAMPSPKNDPSQRERNDPQVLESLSEAYRSVAPYLNISYYFIASIGVFTYLGYKLDQAWQTDPWLMTAGAFLGIVVGFYQFFRIVFKSKPESSDKEP